MYIKREFLKIKEAYSKEKITNILDSMVKYVNQKDSLLVKLEEQQTKMNHASDNIQEIIEIENPIKSMSYDGEKGYYIDSKDIAKDIDNYLDQNEFDHIFICFFVY